MTNTAETTEAAMISEVMEIALQLSTEMPGRLKDREKNALLVLVTQLAQSQARLSEAERKVLDLTEALKHYAGDLNWYCYANHVHSLDDPECRAEAFRTESNGYDIARAALDKIQGEKGQG